MKNKLLICILAVLSILFISSGVYGYILNSNDNNSNDNDNDKENKNNIVYEYYLEDVKVDSIPKNDEENSYLFNKYSCDNDISGNFNSDTWTFDIDNNNISGICKLYFVKGKYNITLTPINGVLDENNDFLVNREEDGIFNILPNEGYKYKESSCSNNKTGDWDSSLNTFTLSAVTSDITCKISFDRKDFMVKVSVVNGNGDTAEKVFYGDSKSIIIEPDSGYENPTINCTNDQIGLFKNNSLTFEKITNDTNCTITFNKTKVEKYNLEITNPTEFENISITEGSNKITNINEGSTAKITLKSDDEEIIPNLICTDEKGNKIIPNINEGNESKTIRTFEFLEVKNNITCKITNK